ncbi:MAG: hypothetical protein AB3N16_04000 [Flavobacteriaceae bacterium]
MKYVLFILPLIWAQTCGTKDQKKMMDDFEGKYVHSFEDCNPTFPEENCVEFLEFQKGSEFASLLFAGGDIVRLMKYQLEGTTLTLTEEMGGLTLKFTVKDRKTLKREDNGDLWVLE